ncbi:unnamed protein product [Urochloa humidicola]
MAALSRAASSAIRRPFLLPRLQQERAMAAASLFGHVEPAPKDPILGVTEAFLADPSPEKVNVGVGAYRDDNGQPVVLECVREAERRIAGNLNIHHNIWRDAQVPQNTFAYYHPESRGLDFSGLMNDIKNAPDGSFFLLHACAHNPTGVDPTEEQWREISHQFKVKKHFPFFDMAYQGFASGDPERDAKAIRIFLEDGHQIGCAQSYAKNMGLYGQRAGCLSILCEDEMQAVAVKSQLQQIARPMYSNPPVHGALVVSIILNDPELKSLWLKEVKALKENLEKLGSPLSWEHITNQIGMFCYSGMTPEQVDRLTNEYHIYMTRNGRISMAGVTTGNVSYLANAIHDVTKPN